MPHIVKRGAGVAIACVLLGSIFLLGAGIAGADTQRGRLTTASYGNAAGKLAYELYVPPTYRQGKARPLVVALHGCTQSAGTFRTLSRLQQLAAERGFIVAFPEQPRSSHFMNCWNWFLTAHQRRDAGEPSVIAGLTKQIQERYTVDRHRTYVAGFSAGGAMAAVLGATYPDLYAAIGVGSGCEYAAGATCAGWQSLDPALAARRAYQAMGARARPLPFVVFHGDSDTTVPPVNADQHVRAGLLTADLADDGQQNRSVPTSPAKTDQRRVRGGRSYTVRTYANGHGGRLAEYWLVRGMGHAWSGGNPAARYADPSGPSESAAMYDFFVRHRAP
jgi:poly(hydroxyalkanoate) depolymerase family esterase